MKTLLLAVVLVLITPFALAQSPPLTTWSAPAGFRPFHQGSITTQSAAPFIAIPPCRQYNSLTSGGPLPDNTPRTVALGGAPCNILSSGIVAVSLNITVFAITGATGNGVFKIGESSPPTTAWINYPSSETQRANAGAMSVDNSTQIVVQVNQGGGSVQFTVDVNGYYPNDVTGTTGQDTFLFKSANNGSGGFGTMRVENTATSGSQAYAISALANSGTDGAAGVFGHALSLNGSVYGVKGRDDSDFGAGVYGFDATGDPGFGNNFVPAGVLGKSKNNYGVRGITLTGDTVVGDVVDTSGAILKARGILGFDATTAVYGNGDLLVTGTKSFVDPHPTDASRVIAYVSLEGPESGIYFRGRGRFERGMATIAVPESFRLVGDEEGLTIQVTPIGRMASFAVVSADLNQIVVRGSADVDFYYLVNGVRKAFKDYDPIKENRFFGRRRDERMVDALSPEQKRRLIANGTYNPDGTVDVETARRLGWDKAWEARERPAIPSHPN